MLSLLVQTCVKGLEPLRDCQGVDFNRFDSGEYFLVVFRNSTSPELESIRFHRHMLGSTPPKKRKKRVHDIKFARCFYNIIKIGFPE